MLYTYDCSGIYCKVFPISSCDCLDLLVLDQYSGRDIVKGTTSICSEIPCWLRMKASLASNLQDYTACGSAIMVKNLISLQRHFYSYKFNITPSACNVQDVMTQMLHGTTTYLNNMQRENCMHAWRQGDLRIYCHRIKFCLRVAVDEFASLGLSNQCDMANLSGENNVFDFTSHTSGKLDNQSLKKEFSQLKETYSWPQNLGLYLCWLDKLSVEPPETRGESLQSTQGYTIAWEPLLFCNHSDKSTTCCRERW